MANECSIGSACRGFARSYAANGVQSSTYKNIAPLIAELIGESHTDQDIFRIVAGWQHYLSYGATYRTLLAADNA